MSYAITFSDVMTGLITIGLGTLGWLLKSWVSELKESNKQNKEAIKQIDEKYEKRISELKDETTKEVRGLEGRIDEFKSDFATTFVLREDYFRAMNKMEDSIKSIDNKIDKLLMRSDK